MNAPRNQTVSSLVSQGMRRIRPKLAIVATLALVVLAGGAGTAAADTTVTVNATFDETTVGDGSCSLREAILFADALPGGEDCGQGQPSGTVTIVLPAGHYGLTHGVLRLARVGRQVTIEGAGAGPTGTTIDAQHTDNVLLVDSQAEAQISGMTITGGQAPPGGDGAPGSDGGQGGFGGGISNFGTLALTDATVTGNVGGDGGSGGNGAGTATGGAGGPGGDGGGIWNAGTLSLTRVTVSANTAGDGGAGGPMHGTNGRSAPPGSGGAGGLGGGIYNDTTATLTLTDTTIAGNSAGAGGQGGRAFFFVIGGSGGDGGFGAGVFNAGTMTVTGSTLSGNLAGAGGDVGESDNPQNNGLSGSGGDGGGIFNAGALTATNATIAANTAGSGGQPNPFPGTGGGLAQVSRTGATLASVTIAQNTALRDGSGIQAGSGPLTITSSVIGANGVQPCGGTITDGGFNVTAQAAECPGTTLGDPKLGPLQNNGGPTQTMALAPGSPAIDLVPAGGPFCPPTDQRGVHRPQGSACDAGAYEAAPPTIAQASAAATSPSTATVTASINPNLQDTAVTVTYGPTNAPSSTTPPLDLGAVNTPVAASVPLNGLRPSATIHVKITAANADGTSHSADITLTTPPVGGPAAPAITRLRQSARRWLEPAARRRTRTARPRRLPIGTTFTFTLNQNSRVTLQFTAIRRGRHHAGQAGAITAPGHAGTNRIHFLGQLRRHRTLAPGRYRLIVIAIAPDGVRSAPAQLTFTIAPGTERAR
jgi:CSLREA domain-containing protein